MNLRFAKGVAIAATFSVFISGCASDGTLSQTGRGAAIGTAAGAALGAAIGSFGANAGRGALIGAIGGALAGGMVGAYMEQQRKDFEKALADQIAAGAIRVERLPDDRLLVGMTGETAFGVDSDQIQPRFYPTLQTISGIVNRYGKTELKVAGHTDSTGSAAHNQQLSERRAASVQSFLEGDGVLPQRIYATGLGKNQPIASNDSESGRRLNRRVDITIIPITEG